MQLNRLTTHHSMYSTYTYKSSKYNPLHTLSTYTCPHTTLTLHLHTPWCCPTLCGWYLTPDGGSGNICLGGKGWGGAHPSGGSTESGEKGIVNTSARKKCPFSTHTPYVQCTTQNSQHRTPIVCTCMHTRTHAHTHTHTTHTHTHLGAVPHCVGGTSHQMGL